MLSKCYAGINKILNAPLLWREQNVLKLNTVFFIC